MLKICQKYCNFPIYFQFPIQTGTTALFFAAQGGHIDVARALIKSGAKIESPSIVSKKFMSILSQNIDKIRIAANSNTHMFINYPI